MIAEFSPFNVSTLFWCLVSITKLSELLLGNGDLGHIQSNSKLRGCDEARSEPIKVSEELSNSNSLLLASRPNAGQDILNVIRTVANNFSFACTSLCLWEVFETMIEVSSNSEKLLFTIHILGEVNVVNLIDIAHIHISS